MTCWSGHMPRMTEEQIAQATRAYYTAAYRRAWTHAWQSPVNPLRDEAPETPENREPRRTTSLEPARTGDKVGAIDVECVRVR